MLQTATLIISQSARRSARGGSEYSLTTKLCEHLREEGCSREDCCCFAFAKEESLTRSLSDHKATVVE